MKKLLAVVATLFLVAAASDAGCGSKLGHRLSQFRADRHARIADRHAAAASRIGARNAAAPCANAVPPQAPPVKKK